MRRVLRARAWCPRGVCNLRRVARDALHMRRAWVTAGPPVAAVPGQVRVRALGMADEPALGRLMWLAFQGSADGEYTAPGDAGADAAGGLAGRWGAVAWPASLAAERDSWVVPALLCVLDDAPQRLPLPACASTDPACHRPAVWRCL